MSIECPRCLLTNPDSSHTCECGYDLTSVLRHRTTARPRDMQALRHRIQPEGMNKLHFAIGIGLVWVLLTIGEWWKIRPEFVARTPRQILQDSILVSLTDLAGALVIGALGWIAVWIVLSYEGMRLRPCPKRTTLAVTVVAAGLLFLGRLAAPDILIQHVMHAVIVLGIAVFAYYAGCRGWLGKW